MSWEVEYYRDSQGNIPVQDFIRQQSAKVKAKILKFIDLLEDLNLSLGQPYVKKLVEEIGPEGGLILAPGTAEIDPASPDANLRALINAVLKYGTYRK